MTEKTAAPLGQTDTNSDHTRVEEVIVECACNRDLTLDELRAVYPERGQKTLEKYLDSLNETMKKYEITSCLRKAHFLAQVGHESSELQYVAEFLDKDPAKDEKIEKEKYGGYKGRGFLQITTETNYTTYGDYVKEDLTDENRKKVEQPKYAADSAGWYWKVFLGEDLSASADQNDLLYITAKVNGGYNGYEGQSTSRLKLLKNAATALHVTMCPQLDALFKAFPEFEKFTYDSYTLEKSKAYDTPDMSFAWGLWHDPKSKQKGTNKDGVQAKLGYSRYAEFVNNKTVKSKKKRFNMTREEMAALAEKRVKEL
ncbi:glycoside hydrolase family 19 protein [Collimonas humicola]|uniref:glycoside hydrolase family 19 protein n=1 Tax=Collimonas humicola TaxID=2825886 RepID=UPI001B8BCCF2|nr:hypothetical protein [Collimonas humicola]